MFETKKVWKAKHLTLVAFQTELHSSSILAAMSESYAARQLNVDLPAAAVKAVVDWVRFGSPSEVRVRDSHPMELQHLETLRKVGFVRLTDENGEATYLSTEWKYIWPWAPLLFTLLWNKFFTKENHEHTPFSDLDSLVKHVVGQLSKPEFRRRLVDTEGRATHENEMNGAIAAVIKSALGKGLLHVSSALRTKDAKLSAQVDHMVDGLPVGRLLLEVCKSQLQEHMNRFLERYQGYEGQQAGVLWIKTDGGPAHTGPKPELPPKCAAYMYEVSERRCNKYDPITNKWTCIWKREAGEGL
jgi:hypothetical protein